MTLNYYTGMLHSGSGHTQVTNFMSSIEIEGMHHRTMKARECEVEPHIQSVAQQSCSEALLEEIQGNVSARRYMLYGFYIPKRSCYAKVSIISILYNTLK